MATKVVKIGARHSVDERVRARIWYDGLKFFSRHLLPVVASTYFIFAWITSLDEDGFYVLGVLLTLQMVLGFLLSILADVYDLDRKEYVGDIVVIGKPDGKKLFSLELDSDESAETIANQSEVTFRIVQAKED